MTLRFLDGFTTAETAEIMGKTEDAVKKLQARGLTQMRKRIAAARLADDGALVARPASATAGERLVSLSAA